MSIFDVPTNELIEKAAKELKKLPEINAPEWAKFVKTGMHKERPPVRADWWHVRAAAMLRSIAKLGPVGVSKLRTKYGGKQNSGVGSEHFYKGSGSIARKVLQQLEKAGLVKQAQKGVHKGRIITPKGQSLLDKSAKEIAKVFVKETVISPEKGVMEGKRAASTPEKKEEKEKKTKPKTNLKKKEKGKKEKKDVAG
jgi:small subunit ribosomal protein S19e